MPLLFTVHIVSTVVWLFCHTAVNGGPGSSAELEVIDAVSTGSTLNSISGSQLPEDGHAEIDKRLYLIK